MYFQVKIMIKHVGKRLTYASKSTGKQSIKSSNDELYMKNSGTSGESVTVSDTFDSLHVYSSKYANQSSKLGANTAMMSFINSWGDIAANDGITAHEIY